MRLYHELRKFTRTILWNKEQQQKISNLIFDRFDESSSLFLNLLVLVLDNSWAGIRTCNFVRVPHGLLLEFVGEAVPSVQSVNPFLDELTEDLKMEHLLKWK